MPENSGEGLGVNRDHVVHQKSSEAERSEEKPESLESVKRNRSSLGKRAALALAGIMAVKGAGETVNDVTNAAKGDYQDSNPPVTQVHVESDDSSLRSEAPTVEPEPESERAKLQREIEEKYEIELLNQREGYERIGKEYDEENEALMGHRPVVRWTMDQLKNANKGLSEFPPGFFSTVDGKKFAISIWDYAEGEEYGGMGHWPYNMISMNEQTFTRDGNVHRLAHEGTHIIDLLKNNGELGRKATEIVGYESFREARLHFKPILDEQYDKGKVSYDNRRRLNYGFMGIDDDGLDRPTEFIASIAASYMDGKEWFDEYRSVFGEVETEKLYEFLKDEIFEGKEYGEQAEEEVNENKSYFDRVWDEFEVLNVTGNREWTEKDMGNLYKTLSALPPSFRVLSDIEKENENFITYFKIGDESGWDKDLAMFTIREGKLKSPEAAFRDIGVMMLPRYDDYESYLERVQGLGFEKDRAETVELFEDLARLYLTDHDKFQKKSPKVIKRFLKDDYNFEKVKEINFLVHIMFDGRKYNSNEKSVSYLEDRERKTVKWKK